MKGMGRRRREEKILCDFTVCHHFLPPFCWPGFPPAGSFPLGGACSPPCLGFCWGGAPVSFFCPPAGALSAIFDAVARWKTSGHWDGNRRASGTRTVWLAAKNSESDVWVVRDRWPWHNGCYSYYFVLFKIKGKTYVWVLLGLLPSEPTWIIFPICACMSAFSCFITYFVGLLCWLVLSLVLTQRNYFLLPLRAAVI